MPLRWYFVGSYARSLRSFYGFTLRPLQVPSDSGSGFVCPHVPSVRWPYGTIAFIGFAYNISFLNVFCYTFALLSCLFSVTYHLFCRLMCLYLIRIFFFVVPCVTRWSDRHSCTLTCNTSNSFRSFAYTCLNCSDNPAEICSFFLCFSLFLCFLSYASTFPLFSGSRDVPLYIFSHGRRIIHFLKDFFKCSDTLRQTFSLVCFNLLSSKCPSKRGDNTNLESNRRLQ